MMLIKKYSVKQILLAIGWIGIAVCCLLLLIAAVKKKDAQVCRGIDINIHGVHNHFFIDKSDVMKIIASNSGKDPIGQPISSFDLVGIESALEKDVWIKNAEIFFDNNLVLQASIDEREPIARVFTTGTSSFYIDSARAMLPLSEKFSARVPVFTGFPSEARVLSNADSNLLTDIKTISLKLETDSFMNALVQQVAITPSRTFELVPYIGNQVIILGDANDIDQKFNKLSLFYRKIIAKFGWKRYSVINLQYKGQVVAKLKGADDITADSLRTIQLMHAIAATAERLASDSIQTIIQDNERNTADSSMIQQSIQREDGFEPTLYFEDMAPKPDLKSDAVKKDVKADAIKKGAVKPKPATKKAATASKPLKKEPVKPKITMPSKNKN